MFFLNNSQPRNISLLMVPNEDEKKITITGRVDNGITGDLGRMAGIQLPIIV
jgi:hypothetical protein